MSLYSHKQNGTGAVQPWSQAVTLAEAGKGCDGLFGLYDSLGDKTLVGANTISTLLDGPEKVVRYGALTLGDGTTPTSLTAANRCKGLAILCDSLTVKANATLHMTGKGPKLWVSDDPLFPLADFRIPTQVVLLSDKMSLGQALSVIKGKGLALWDQGVWSPVYPGLLGFTLAISQAGVIALAMAGNGGAGAIYSQSIYNVNNTAVGVVGGAGTQGCCGGGGSGGSYAVNPDARSACGRPGSIYTGGGGGGGGMGNNHPYLATPNNFVPNFPCYSYGLGAYSTNPSWPVGGGAGTPFGAGVYGGGDGGNGVGGRLIVICRSAVTVQSGGKIEANGMPGGSSTYCGGGGSGGGAVFLIAPTAGSLANAGTIQAAGGAGGVANPVGGAGGAGSVVTKTFSDMGW